MNHNLVTWHDIVATKNVVLLKEILAEDVIFHSPVVHSPQKGKKMTYLYLSAALQVFLSEEFVYTREVVNETETFLEFEVIIDGITINGIDLITWDKEGKIIDFKVMIRPLKAMNLIHQKMGEILAEYQKRESTH
ncbi:nuclear transport factor 2 family protein [Flavobacteriaceae bacterium S356]|uniref:Nuclear transport factor 2 family protein n=1 Tax=Asprobacillus argus TaxID=3076534 RepID=A0ABU3LHM7_9FLAO|nr:nuclear transport factor 2 family protein [Flavobacteriaceae bacterium S356]